MQYSPIPINRPVTLRTRHRAKRSSFQVATAYHRAIDRGIFPCREGDGKDHTLVRSGYTFSLTFCDRFSFPTLSFLLLPFLISPNRRPIGPWLISPPKSESPGMRGARRDPSPARPTFPFSLQDTNGETLEMRRYRTNHPILRNFREINPGPAHGALPYPLNHAPTLVRGIRPADRDRPRASPTRAEAAVATFGPINNDAGNHNQPKYAKYARPNGEALWRARHRQFEPRRAAWAARQFRALSEGQFDGALWGFKDVVCIDPAQPGEAPVFGAVPSNQHKGEACVARFAPMTRTPAFREPKQVRRGYGWQDDRGFAPFLEAWTTRNFAPVTDAWITTDALETAAKTAPRSARGIYLDEMGFPLGHRLRGPPH